MMILTKKEGMFNVFMRVMTCVIVLFGLIGFADFVVIGLEHIIPFYIFDVVVGWAIVIFGLIYFIKHGYGK